MPGPLVPPMPVVLTWHVSDLLALSRVSTADGLLIWTQPMDPGHAWVGNDYAQHN